MSATDIGDAISCYAPAMRCPCPDLTWAVLLSGGRGGESEVEGGRERGEGVEERGGEREGRGGEERERDGGGAEGDGKERGKGSETTP
eukprot:2097257-Rhodomonas_salina.6